MRAQRFDIARLGMMIAAIALAVVLWPGSTGVVHASSCIDCHSAFDDPEISDPAKKYSEDIHFQKGLSCEDCHGGNASKGFEEGDPDLAHDTKAGFVGAPKTSDIPLFCARCHSDVEYMKEYNPKLRVDQFLEYRSSVHGKRLETGDTKVATCVSCHSVHDIRSVKDARAPVYKTNVARTCSQCHSDAAYMKSYSIPTNQYELYLSSVHGEKLEKEGDLAAPTCNNCHGNHGAAPPGLMSVSNSCGECHANNLDYFNQSPHKDAFADLGAGECNACHGHHDVAKSNDTMLGVSDDATCVMCHDTGDAGYQAAAAMAGAFDSLKAMLVEAHALLDKAERGGVNVSLGKFDLHSADDALIKARTAVHYFDTSKFNPIITSGVTAAENVMDLGNKALWDLKLRQIGLGFTLPLVLLVALLLYLKIRQIERRKPIP